jgi:D-aminopeptidase
MIAWEKFIDATRNDPDGLYNRLSAPVRFRNGDPAGYGFGLARATLAGRAATCHGGGLRGWRSFRCHIAAERLSVVVLFNHMADPRAATLDLLAALFGETAPMPPPADGPAWDGHYIEPQSGLAVRIETLPDRRLRLHYATGPDILTATAPGHAAGGGVVLAREAAGLRMTRMPDHQSAILQPCEGTPTPDIAGVFHCEELGATLTFASAGGALYGAFSGDLGQGAMQPLIGFAPDVWLLPGPRALDYAAPGDWTLSCRRDAAGKVAAIEVGCWLARHLVFERTP